jgi:hypothetical protein
MMSTEIGTTSPRTILRQRSAKTLRPLIDSSPFTWRTPDDYAERDAHIAPLPDPLHPIQAIIRELYAPA